MTTPTRFKRFDPSTIRDFASILFAGGKRTGKSSLMREFMWFIKDRVYDGHVWSGTYDEDHPWEWYFPKQMVHYCMEEFQEEALNKTLQVQQQRKDLAKKYGATCPPSVLVFEDLEFLKPSIWNKQGTRSLIFNGRLDTHLLLLSNLFKNRWVKEFCLVAYQYVMEVKMEMRGSFDYAVFTMDNSKAVRERIWKQFAGVFGTLESFEAAFMELTKDYRAMVIDLRARSYKLEDCVYWYRANPNLARFKIGHPDIWIPRPIASTAPISSNRFVLEDEPPKNKKKTTTPRKKKTT